MNPPRTGYHPISQVALLLETEVIRAMLGKHVQFFEAFFVQQNVEALAGGEFPFGVLIFNALGTSAQERPSTKLFEVVVRLFCHMRECWKWECGI